MREYGAHQFFRCFKIDAMDRIAQAFRKFSQALQVHVRTRVVVQALLHLNPLSLVGFKPPRLLGFGFAWASQLQTPLLATNYTQQLSAHEKELGGEFRSLIPFLESRAPLFPLRSTQSRTRQSTHSFRVEGKVERRLRDVPRCCPWFDAPRQENNVIGQWMPRLFLPCDAVKSLMGMTKTFHVYPVDQAWTVKKEGLKPETFQTKQEAVARARHIVKRAKGTQIVVHAKDGRIVESRTYGMPKIHEHPKRGHLQRKKISTAVGRVVLNRVRANG